MTSLFCLGSASCWCLSWLTLQPWRWRRHVPPKRRLTSKGLHGVISKKTERFITAERTSNPVQSVSLQNGTLFRLQLTSLVSILLSKQKNDNTHSDTVLPIKEAAVHLYGCLKLRVMRSEFGSSVPTTWHHLYSTRTWQIEVVVSGTPCSLWSLNHCYPKVQRR
jgi:hypothetical protein